MRRAVILGVIGLLVLAAAFLLRRGLDRQDDVAASSAPTPPARAADAAPASAAPVAAPAPTAPAVTASTPTAAPPAASKPASPPSAVAAAPRQLVLPPPTEPPPPSFDIVRVTPRGDAVIAGRAEPKAEVRVLDGERVVGTVTADPRGEWVLLPTAPLPSGERQLTLQAQRPGASPGAAPVVSDQVVVVVVPEPSVAQRPDAAAPVAVLMTRGEDGRWIVVPGDSLWDLARRTYGRGLDYDAIFQANRDQIRNPDLIYPGQVFVIPPGR